MSFDLQNLLRMGFPDALCPHCAAILFMDELFDDSDSKAVCPGCFNSLECSHDAWSEFFEGHPGSLPRMNELSTLAHAHELMSVVYEYQNAELSSIDLLLQLLNKSRYFIHFSTWNFTTELLGVLAMAALNVPVRGIIGEPLDMGSDAYKVCALNVFQKTVLGLELTLTGTGTTFDQTHHKIYIFDGIVALIGSPNLTLSAWIKVSESREQLDIVTEPARVRTYNNRYISRFMRRRSFDSRNPTESNVA